MEEIDLPTFSGPVTAIGLTEWLNHCEKSFRLWDEDYGPPNLTDYRKVDAAGSQILAGGATRQLASWWVNNGIITTWAAFKDEIKEEALSADWRARTLETLYTTKQEGKTVNAYIQELEENRIVIANAGQLRRVDDFTFKCIMLFHASPFIVAQVMDSGFDVIGATVNQVRDRIRRVSSPVGNIANSASQTLPQTMPQIPRATNGNGYVLLDAWGLGTATFNDMNSLPRDSKNLGPMTKITLWGNGDSSTYMLQSYSFDFSGQGLTLANPAIPHFQTQKCEHVLEKGEYITSVNISGTKYRTADAKGKYLLGTFCSISSMTITTANPAHRLISAPSQSALKVDDQVTFTAPSGMRIVGFCGYAGATVDFLALGNSRWPLLGLGAILAPLAI